jgi:hypothetical protein
VCKYPYLLFAPIVRNLPPGVKLVSVNISFNLNSPLLKFFSILYDDGSLVTEPVISAISIDSSPEFTHYIPNCISKSTLYYTRWYNLTIIYAINGEYCWYTSSTKIIILKGGTYRIPNTPINNNSIWCAC